KKRNRLLKRTVKPPGLPMGARPDQAIDAGLRRASTDQSNPALSDHRSVRQRPEQSAFRSENGDAPPGLFAPGKDGARDGLARAPSHLRGQTGECTTAR